MDEDLLCPLEEKAAEEYRRERWGLEDEAVAASENVDELFPESVE